MRLLKVSEVARIKRVREQTVRRWLADGRLPYERVGHQYLIPADAIDGADVQSIARDDYETYVDNLVDAAPDLSLEQIQALKVLLGGGR